MIKRLPYLFVGWMWYLITIAPVIGIIQISAYAMADHYHYLPSIGIAVILAWGMPSLIKGEQTRKKILFPAGIAFLVIMAVLTWQQCGYWKNSATLFNQALRVTKGNYLAHNARGITYGELGLYNLAIEDFSKSIDLKKDYADAYNNRGFAYYNIDQYQPAIEDFNKAIELKRNYTDAYFNRALVYFNQNKNKMGCLDAQKVCELGNCTTLKDAQGRGLCP